jgi:hypothetical protein
MVDNLKGLDELLKDPKLAATRAQIEKERAEAPQDKTDRLVSEDDYERRMRRIEGAEAQAREEKLGWSDSMKADREAEGLPVTVERRGPSLIAIASAPRDLASARGWPACGSAIRSGLARCAL